MFESTAPLRAEFPELETALADPAVHADLVRARKVGRRYAELMPIMKALDGITPTSAGEMIPPMGTNRAPAIPAMTAAAT